MKLQMLAILAIGLFAGQLAAQEKPPLKKPDPVKKGEAKQSDFKSINEKVGYVFGMNFGSSLKMLPLKVDINMMVRGIEDALAGSDPALSDEEIQEAMEQFQKDIDTANKKQEQTFLASNKKKDGVKELPSGLQYKVLKKGTGKRPKLEDSVSAHYRGTLLNGAEFDSSYKRGEPAEFPLQGVIKGWTEALQQMDEGSKWELFVPAKLAYGERGKAPIGPNTMLVFEVELLKVIPGEDKAGPAPTSKLPRLKLPEKKPAAE